MSIYQYCQHCDAEIEHDDALELENCVVCGVLICLGCAMRTETNDITCRYCQTTDDELGEFALTGARHEN